MLRNLPIYFFVLLVAASGSKLSAQVPNTLDEEIRQARERQNRADQDLEQRMVDMRRSDEQLRKNPPSNPTGIRSVPKLTTEQRERILQMRRISGDDADKYRSFLTADRSGIVKLFPDIKCVTRDVVRVDADCGDFVPLSSDFMFRTNSYSDSIYHDIMYSPDKLSSNSFFSQGIMTSLGDVPVEMVSLTTAGMLYLSEYQADTEANPAAKHAHEFRDGVQSNGFTYADSIKPVVNNTYAMRLIAYRLDSNLPPVGMARSMDELLFQSLAYDKRVDVTVTFRVIRMESNGAMTIVWKELDRRESPKIKYGKGAKLVDFRSGLGTENE